MHIVHIHESFGGGTLTIVADIVRKTHSLGWKTTIFHGRRPETPADFRALFPQGTIFQRLHTGRQVNPVLDLFDTVRIAVYACRHRASLLHGHAGKGGALARLSGLLCRRRPLYTPHGFAFLGGGARRLTYGLERVLGLLPAVLICCSRSEADIALGLSRDVLVVPNFVDAAGIEAIAAAIPAPECDVLAVGRMSWQKNPALFMEAARRLPHLRFVWAGGPSDALPAVPPNVEITGWLTREQVLARTARASIFLSTSRYEGLPVAVLEAQALRRPVVATDSPGTRDVVVHGHTGLVANSPDEIAAALDRLIRDAALRRTLGANARNMANALHNPGVNLELWTEFYQLLRAKHP